MHSSSIGFALMMVRNTFDQTSSVESKNVQSFAAPQLIDEARRTQRRRPPLSAGCEEESSQGLGQTHQQKTHGLSRWSDSRREATV
mmetsp:Transcript_27377/g.45576  ORF Transcript_27377/g.45576 Transcript_27377/m.45576 type:complete len:86 (-) Transcript_27377:425-682(-)